MLETLRPVQPVYPEVSRGPRIEPASAISLSFLLDALRRRWIVLALAIGLMVVLGTAYALLTPKKYAATASLLIDTRLAQLSQTDAAASVVDQAAVESQIELLRSEKMLTSVINKLDLLQDPEFGSATSQDSDEAPTTPGVALRRAIAIMTANLGVSRVGRSYLVSVTYNSPDSIKAARIANAVAAAYIADQIDAKVQAAKDQNAWLEAQVTERRAYAAQTYRNVENFKDTHDINPMRDLDTQQESDRLSSEASRAHAATITARANLDRTQALLTELTPKAPLPVASLRALQDPGLNALLGGYGGAMPAGADGGTGVPSTAGPADGAGADVHNAVRDRLAAIEADQRGTWQTAAAKQQSVDSELGDVRLRDTRSRLIQERLRELETEAASSRSLYESYLNQLTHAAQQQPVPASDTRVISPATVPLYPSSPKKRLIVPLAGIAGAMLGLMSIFAIESLDKVIRTRDRLVAATDLPCLGVIPRVAFRRLRRSGSPMERLRDGFPLLGAAGPRSKAADALRSLQLAAISSPGTSSAPVLGVTSAVAGEGKTTVALNLAFSAHQAGRRVLLVDANLRDPRLSELVLPDGESTVAEYSLSRAVSVDTGFDILPASPENTIAGAELPDLRLFGAALVEARTRYDLVIVDLPAILPLSELQAVVSWTDLLVLVTRWGSTTSIQIERALERLSEANCLFGAILNAVNIRVMRRYEGSVSHSYADRVRF